MQENAVHVLVFMGVAVAFLGVFFFRGRKSVVGMLAWRAAVAMAVSMVLLVIIVILGMVVLTIRSDLW